MWLSPTMRALRQVSGGVGAPLRASAWARSSGATASVARAMSQLRFLRNGVELGKGTVGDGTDRSYGTDGTYDCGWRLAGARWARICRTARHRSAGGIWP